MSNTIDDIDLENSTASTLFDKGWKFQQELEKASDECSPEYDQKRKKTIIILQKCESMLDELGIFSENESLEEISANELRYFINDALIAWLFSKVNSPKPEQRLPSLQESKKYYLKYLNLTYNYGIHKFRMEKFDANKNENSNNFSETKAGRQAAFDESLINQAHDRNEKIKRYREQKELEAKLSACQVVLLKPHIDEEQKSEIYNIYIKYWLNKTLDELKIINDEINILHSFGKEQERPVVHRLQGATGGLPPAGKPYIITKDAMQAKVFGAGYPSVPVYSIEEFYDQLADKGMMPHCGVPPKDPVQIGKGVTESQKQEEKAEKDLLEDRDDEAELRKQREWDEFKDDNKRGAGNRYNRS
ncbi:unnamed protein product [Brachionus calyciflorus]|uniref:Immunoglobulin-binding protein 1 n=1 Tax=Brachionus calyciflorus TaxID=104777 RepID=A0A813R3A4_9BILA|nr:unnamed protein product [Brachionus calyciflorus]